MTMNNFDLNHLADTPGVTYKRFCSFQCTNEATGEIRLGPDPESPPIPVCEECVDKMEAHVQKLMRDAGVVDNSELGVID